MTETMNETMNETMSGKMVKVNGVTFEVGERIPSDNFEVYALVNPSSPRIKVRTSNGSRWSSTRRADLMVHPNGSLSVSKAYDYIFSSSDIEVL